MNIITRKTWFLSVTGHCTSICIDRRSSVGASKFTYLGRVVSTNGVTKFHVTQHINSAGSALNSDGRVDQKAEVAGGSGEVIHCESATTGY